MSPSTATPHPAVSAVLRELLTTTEYNLDRGECQDITDTVDHIRYMNDQDTRPIDSFDVMVGNTRVTVTAKISDLPAPELDKDNRVVQEITIPMDTLSDMRNTILRSHPKG